MVVPKRKIEEFIKEINQAKTKQELENILKRLETFSKLHPSEESEYILAFVYFRLEKYKEALEILKTLENYEAKFLKAEILRIIEKYKEAYRLYNQLENIAPNEEEKMKIAIRKLSILITQGKYEEAKQILDKYGDKLLNFADKIGVFDTVAYIKSKIEDYEEGLKIVNQDKELQEIQEQIKQIASKYFDKFKVYPMLTSYYDGDDENLTFYVVLPEKPGKDKEKKFEFEVIEKVNFNYPNKEFYTSIRYVKPGVEALV